ncbi:MAG TPA: hypothetical protein PLY93_00500, partial [Turneriella sp.]|nr:hypothetical protein [Turneriella sp.]
MFLKQIALISASTLFILSCARLGEAKSLTSAQEAVATQLIIPTDATKPGMGQDGGPLTWSFWVKNRQASAELMLGSFTPFYKINTLRRAVSQHFVLYADTASAALVSSSVNRIAVLTSGSTTVAGLSATGDLAVGMRVTGGGLPCATYIASITNSAVVEITNPAPTSGTPTLTFAHGPSVILDSMECAYSNLLHVYGGDKHPYANNNARIVILANDILDDYATTGGYVGGYFAPRDLYSNAFTTSLFTNPAAIQQNAQLVGQLGGYSNEMSVVYYDLNPGYTTAPNQVNDIVLHELSHLFTYNYRVIQQRYKNLDLWIAEGVAENAPPQTNGSGNLLTLRLSQMGSPALFASYQAAPQLVDFQTWGPKIVGYLQSNLFFSYLRHRLELNSTGSAASFVHDAVTQIDTSMNGINALISTYLPSENFSTIYQDFVTTHYLMLLGIQIEDTNGMNGGGINLQQKYSFCKSEIGISNTGVNNCTSIKARYSSNIPFNYDAPRCSDNTYGLKPNSYIIYRHKVAGDRTHFDIPGTDPVAGELPLKIIINTTPEATLISGPPATVNLYTYNAGDNIPFTSSLGFVNGDIAQIIVVNPNPTGSCRKLDETWLLKRNHSKWVGQNSFGVHASPDFYWQSDAGASWLTDTDGAYYRPAGLAADLQGYPNNRLYISDYINMSVQRLNLDTGEPLGRLGSPSNTCPTTGMPWSTSTNRYLNGYCAHNFNSPQGLAVHKDHNLYVADTD